MQRPTYDYSPLTEKITFSQLFADVKMSLGLKIGIAIAVIALTLPIIAIDASSPDIFKLGLSIYAVTFLILIAVIMSMLINRIHYAKLQRFAKRNQMLITRDFDLLQRPGAPFHIQIPADNSISLTTSDSPSIEIGNFVATNRKNVPTAYGSFGFIKFVLPREFPHIVLDAKASDVITRSTAAPLSFYIPEVIKLEGDFSSTFNVYAPTGYDSDLRYILPPDFMAFLMDHASMFDIEFIDNELYLYGVNFFSLTAPSSLDEIFEYAYDFQQAIHHHLVPYVDWRVGNRHATTISVEGKQLSKASPRYLITLVIVVVILLAYYLLY